MSKNILICSCGAGTEPVRAARAGAEVYAVDISPTGVQKALEMAAFNGVSIQAEVMDLHDLKYPPDFFDVIYGSAVLHHLDCARAAKEFHRCLKPNGIGYFFEETSDRNPILRFFYRLLSATDADGNFKKFLFVKRRGVLDERMLSSLDIAVLDSVFPSNVRVTVDGFMFFQKLSHVTGGRLQWLTQAMDMGLDKLAPGLRRYSYEQNIWFRKPAA